MIPEIAVSDFYLGILIAVAVAVITGVVTAFQKRSVDETDEFVTSWAFRFFGLPVVLPVIAWTGMPEIDYPKFLIAIFISSLGLTFATILTSKAFSISEISLVTPIFALSPALLLITSPVIVGQFPSPKGLLGVLLITAGAYSLKAKRGRLFDPFKSLAVDRGVQLVFLVVVIYAITANVDKVGLDASSAIFWTFSLLFASSILLFPVMVKQTNDWKSQLSSNIQYLVPLGMLAGLSSLLQMIALELIIVPYFVSIKRTSILVSVILGWLIFGDQDPGKRIAGAALMVAGAAILYIFGQV